MRNTRALFMVLLAPAAFLAACSEAPQGDAGHDHDHDHGAMTAHADGEDTSRPRAQSPEGGTQLPYYQDEAFTPVWLDPSAEQLDGFHAIPDFVFTNQDGKTVSSADYDNKIYVSTFFFATCPGICSPVNERVSLVQDAFADDDEVRILSHSITPDIDTVDALKTYANDHGIKSSKWDLITGDRDAIYEVAKSGYFASDDLGDPEAAGDFKHTENVLLIDKDRRIRGIYNGLSRTAMANLIADIRLLKSEQADS